MVFDSSEASLMYTPIPYVYQKKKKKEKKRNENYIFLGCKFAVINIISLNDE